jgi:DNA-binding HxlR family transcriptional regulator
MTSLRPDQVKTIGELVLNSVVAQSLGLLGDRCTLLTIRDLFLGRHRFEALLEHTGAVRSTLARRLKVLVEQEVVYRSPYQKSPVRYEYRLTPKGLQLYGFALGVWAWEHTWLDDDAMDLPPRLVHRKCKHSFMPVCKCLRCEEAITSRSVFNRPNPDGVVTETATIFSKRRSKVDAASHSGADGSLFHATDILGDRWNNLILGGALYGLSRYDDFQRGLGIATNILADRLRFLVDAGLFRRVAYQAAPKRYRYKLTPKGEDYLPVAMALHQWSERWLTDGQGGNVILSHHCHDSPILFFYCCSVCGEVLDPHEVEIGKLE